MIVTPRHACEKQAPQHGGHVELVDTGEHPAREDGGKQKESGKYQPKAGILHQI